jgi:hypothetical protein
MVPPFSQSDQGPLGTLVLASRGSDLLVVLSVSVVKTQ